MYDDVMAVAGRIEANKRTPFVMLFALDATEHLENSQLSNRIMGMAKNYRSAGSGRFVTKSTATKSPSKTVGETRGGGSTGGTHRSAGTGRFVTDAYAAKHPKTTIKDS